MKTPPRVLDFYRRTTAMTFGGVHARLLEPLPQDVTALSRIVQGLGIYDLVAADFYGHPIAAERADEIHIRPIEKMLERLVALDAQPLSVRRPEKERLVSRCRHFTLLL